MAVVKNHSTPYLLPALHRFVPVTKHHDPRNLPSPLQNLRALIQHSTQHYVATEPIYIYQRVPVY